MKRFIEVADSYTKPRGTHRGFAPATSAPDAQLAKAICAMVVQATPKFTWRGIRCLLRPAV